MADFPSQPQYQPRSQQLPSDLRHKIARCYVDDREFKDDSGKVVKYSRLVVVFSVGNEDVSFESRIRKNDKALLAIAEDFSAGHSL